DGHCGEGEQDHDGRAQGELDERLATLTVHGAKTSFCRVTMACRGSPSANPAGTNAGTTPPTSTVTSTSLSCAQTQTIGAGGGRPGHHLVALTPTTPAARIR